MKSPVSNDDRPHSPEAEEADASLARPAKTEAPRSCRHDGKHRVKRRAGTRKADGEGPRQVIEQAASDIAHGLRDTERRGIPSDVPGPGPAPEHSPGASVPKDGVDVAGYANKHPAKKHTAKRDPADDDPAEDDPAEDDPAASPAR
jgi:hypothetical protein